jgi:uncharacterized membrane protein
MGAFSSLIIGPAFLSLLVHYFIMLNIPRWRIEYFLSFVLLLNLLVLFRFHSKKRLKSYLLGLCAVFREKNPSVRFLYRATILILLLVCILLLSFKYITGNDMLEYGALGKLIYKERFILLSDARIDKDTGFLSRSAHGYLFPIFYTINLSFNQIFNSSSDLFFRSISLYYGVLLLFLVRYWAEKMRRQMGFLVYLTFASTLGYMITMFEYHIDTFRIALLTLSVYYAYYLVDKHSEELIHKRELIFLVVSGLAANAHILVFAGILMLHFYYAMFASGNFFFNVKKLIAHGGFLFIFGCYFYVFDIFQPVRLKSIKYVIIGE